MSNGLERRLYRLERLVADRREKQQVCNCRVETCFHNAKCLDAVLKGLSLVCPVHGFRELGFFFWTPQQCPLEPESNQFCPCAPHPWRSFVTSEGPHTWEGHRAARAGWNTLPLVDHFDAKEENQLTTATVAKYFKACQRWIEQNRWKALPAKEELVNLQWKRARKHGNQEPRASV